MKITNAEHNNEIYSIHNIKILIVMLLAKIMEKTHQHEEKIKLTDIIKKRNFKSSKKSKNEINDNNKKNIPSINNNNNDEIINVNSINNKKIVLEEKQNIINTIETEKERKCILKPNITNIIKGIYELMQ
jgi:RNase adaptor protein for sRNA GlmZ degradation